MQERLYFLGGGPVKSDLILLVEDNPDDVKQTLRSFARHQIGNEVVVARDGAEALDYLFGRGAFVGRDSSEVPGLILLDLKLPRVGGLQVLTQIRADERTKLVPVVVLTSSSEDQDRIRSYSNGANIFVRKPVDFTGILTAARSLGLYWTLLNSGLTLIHREKVPVRGPARVSTVKAVGEPDRAPPEEPRREASASSTPEHAAEVVVIDDDEDLRRLITTVLRVDGHAVRHGKNARDAFRLLFSQLPDVLIVDNQLADINGIEIVRALRETPQGQTVTPILLAADVAGAMKDLRDPRVSVQPKPVDVFRLADLVRGLFPARHAEAEHPSPGTPAWELLGVPMGAPPAVVTKAAETLIRQFTDLEGRTECAELRVRASDALARIRAAERQLLDA